MNHLHRNWRRRWTINLDNREAVHPVGVVIRFRPVPDGWGQTVVAGIDLVHPNDLAKMSDQAFELFQAEIAKCTDAS